jgi:hypothetical protein
MTDCDPQNGLVGEFLQFDFPESYPGTVAAASVCGNQQAAAVSWSTPTLTRPVLLAMSQTP